MECGRGVAKPEEHHCQLEESFVHDEGCLPLMAILDVDVVVPLTNIKFCEVASIFQLFHEVGDEREGVCITGGVFIEVSVILAGAEFAVLLLDKEERGCLEGVGRMDLSSS